MNGRYPLSTFRRSRKCHTWLDAGVAQMARAQASQACSGHSGESGTVGFVAAQRPNPELSTPSRPTHHGKLRYPLSTLLLALLLPASTLGHSPAQLEKMQVIAAAEFPNGCAAVEVDGTHPIHETFPTALAWAGDCKVTLGLGFDSLSSLDQCRAIVHEYGHLAGYGHSDDPNSIMSVLLSGRVAACEWAFLRSRGSVRGKVRRKGKQR